MGAAHHSRQLQAPRADWISLEELLQLTGWDARTVRRKKASGELRSRPIAAAKNGKPRHEYDASSLPADIQAKRLQQSIAGGLVKTSSGISNGTLLRTMASLEGAARDQAQQRLDVISPLIEFSNSGQTPCGAQQPTVSSIVKFIATSQRQSERTIWNWWNAYKASGPGALADRPRKDRNTSRFFSEHKEAAAFVGNKFLNERLSILMTHEALLREWPRLRLSDDDVAPAYETTRVFLNSLPPIITAVAHGGERAYKDDFAPFLLRDRSKLKANQFWISDHMIHDVWVRNFDLETGAPVFGEMPLNAPFRPWLTAIEDMKSRRIVAHVWCATPSSHTISSALRYALCNFGAPESAFYVDNGKDYNKVSDDARGVLARLGIRTQHCIPRHPQSKQIESFFHILHQRFDVLWRPFYAGISPKHKPEECDQALAVHKNLMASGRGNESPLPAASEFIQQAANWLELEWNNSFKDKARGMAKRTPREIFDADLPPSSRTVIDARDVAPLFWDRQKRIVREGGTVQLFNARYEPADADSAAALTLSIKREVLIACDPLNVGMAIALTHDEKFLGVLRAQELLVHGETSQAQISASMRERRKIFKALKRNNSMLAQSRLAAGDLCELEVLASRAVGAGVRKPVIHALPVAKAVNGPTRVHVEDIVEKFFED